MAFPSRAPRCLKDHLEETSRNSVVFVREDFVSKKVCLPSIAFCIYIYIPGTCLSSILVVEPFKRRPFPNKTRVIWVPGVYIYIYIAFYTVNTMKIREGGGADIQYIIWIHMDIYIYIISQVLYVGRYLPTFPRCSCGHFLPNVGK